MKAIWTVTLSCLFVIGPVVSAQELENAATEQAIAKAALLEEIRDRIVWYPKENIYPLFIPEDVFALASVQELPIPVKATLAIQYWIFSNRKDAETLVGDPNPGCAYPARAGLRLAPSRKQITLDEAMATRTSTLLVKVDKTMRGLWPDSGIYQYNEVTPLRILAGSGVHQDSLSTRAFLSEGGEIVVDGTLYCSKSPWHQEAPRVGDVYLLLGSIDIPGIFNPYFYFRIEDGNIVPATYPELKATQKPLPLDRVLARLADSRKSGAIHSSSASPKDGEKQPDGTRIPSGPRGLAQGDGDLFCEEFQGLCDSSADLAWRRQDACKWECTSQSHYRDKAGSCHWECGPPPTTWQRAEGTEGVGPRVAFLNVREGDSLSGRPVLRGFAMDFTRVAVIELYWNGRRLRLQRFETGLPSPEACALPLGLPHSACVRDSGFSAEVDTTRLADGPGTLALVATDLEGWTSSLELDLIVANKK